MVNALTEIVSLDSTLNIDENGPFKLNDDKLLSALVVVLLGEIESPEAFLQNGETVTAGYTAKVFYKNAEIDFGGGLSFTAIGTMETLIDALKTEIDALNTNYEGIVVTLKIDDDGKVNIAVEFADTVDPLDVFNAASGLVNALTEIVSLDSTLNIDENGPFKLNDDKLLSALVVVLLGEIESPEAFLQNGETVTAGYTAKVFYKNAEIDFGGGLSFKVSSYTITWIVNGQTYIVTTVDSGDKVVLPTDPSEDGYTFKGWFASIEFTVPVTTDTEPTAGTSYFAKMDPIEYTINFGEGITVKKGETPIDTGDQIAYGTVLTVTADPKTGHTSKLSATAGTIDTDGKYTVEGEVTFSVTYTAIKYTITFDTGDGSEIDSISGDYNTPAEAPTDPVLTGYAFMGWTKNLAGEPVVKFVFDEDTVFNEDFTLYAIWEIEEYTITFDTGDGSTVNPIIADYDTEITAPANPTRAGYDFVRWDTAIPVKMPANDLTITAVWKLKVFEEPPTDDDIEDIIETNENPVIRLDDEIDDFVIGNTVFENIGEKVLVIDVVDDDDKVLYSWSFSGDYKADAGTFKPKVSVKEDVEEMTEALKASKIENPLVLDFSASGTLPMEASVKYYVGDKFASGTVISLFFFNEESNELEDQGQEIVVDDDGYAVFTLTHCSYYILGESAESGEGSPNYMPLIGIALASIIVIVVAMFVILNRRN
ncbi:MAG: InlB B-repeat-containing protein [Candidatus Methanomethylophilaceae archaeon]